MTFSPDYLCQPRCAAQDALAEQLEARKADMDEIERLRAVILDIARIVENPDDRALQCVRDLTDKEKEISVKRADESDSQ